jgi:hypothetical protein
LEIFNDILMHPRSKRQGQTAVDCIMHHHFYAIQEWFFLADVDFLFQLLWTVKSENSNFRRGGGG